jgi:hypothetical protein
MRSWKEDMGNGRPSAARNTWRENNNGFLILSNSDFVKALRFPIPNTCDYRMKNRNRIISFASGSWSTPIVDITQKS